MGMFVALCCWLIILPETTAVKDCDTLVICPLDFQPALKPWVSYRERQGYRISVQEPSSTSAGLLSQLKHFAATSPLKNVVLIGDAVDARVPQNCLVPTDFVTAEVNVKFGSEPEIATDHTYADLDSDNIVELNLGRIPVDTREELSTYIQRVIDYESGSDQMNWQRRVNFVAGVGGFGQLVDKMIEQTVRKIVTDLIPAAYDVSMTYGSWRSPYCPDPRRFAQTTISRFNEGCMFWVYIGHGDRRRLDRLKLPDRRYEILNDKNVAAMACESGAPVAICLSCYTAAIDDNEDGLAELMFKQNRGPIAVISSSRVSMPYAMSIFSLELLDGYFQGELETIGELVKDSKSKMVKFDDSKSEYHRLVQSMGKTFSPEPELLKEERQEHVHLMHLLGDPLLKLHRPHKLEIKAQEVLHPGQRVTVTGVAERAGDLSIDLCYRRDRFRYRPPRRRNYDASDDNFNSFQDVYQKSQNLICNTVTVQVQPGPFSIELPVPDDSSGECHIRGELQGQQYYAVGSLDVQIR